VDLADRVRLHSPVFFAHMYSAYYIVELATTHPHTTITIYFRLFLTRRGAIIHVVRTSINRTAT